MRRFFVCFGAGVLATCAFLSMAAPGVAFPGANGRIALVRGHDLLTMEPDGTDVVKIADGKGAPAWSPDGRFLAATHTGPRGGSTLFVMRADGSHVLTLGDGAQPAWAPDGLRIAFARDGQLWIMRSDGTHQRHLELPLGVGGPAWSPDGRLIAVSGFAPDTSLTDIYVVRPDGGGLTKITQNDDPEEGAAAPAWKADGTMIAYSQRVRVPGSCSVISEIDVLRLAGGRPRTLRDLKFTLSASDPAWQPRGPAVVFDDLHFEGFPSDCSSGAVNREIASAVLNHAARNLTRTREPVDESDPDWQPRCTIVGTGGPDLLDGTSGRDVICAFGGDDVIEAGDGDDVIFAGDGNDIVTAGPGDDVVAGGPGSDSLSGSGGDDLLNATDDVSANDDIDGRTGSDLCIGDPGDSRASCP